MGNRRWGGLFRFLVAALSRLPQEFFDVACHVDSNFGERKEGSKAARKPEFRFLGV
jgi:hypothetical protein